jgi:hypothetical protein
MIADPLLSRRGMVPLVPKLYLRPGTRATPATTANRLALHKLSDEIF